jgi:hypothetical protein
MEIPTARILDDGVLRLGAAQALPFRWYTAAMGVFPGLEFSGRLTQITNIESGLGEDYGSNKDKAFDLKYQLFPECRWLPALAFGAHDLFGTQQFEAQYVVLSRQVFPFDFTLGVGRKRLHGASLPVVDELGVFGGIEFALHPRLSLMAEYNPIDYESDPASVRGVPEGADLPINVGLRFKIFPNVFLGASFQRGDTLGLSLHFQEKLGEPILPQRADPPPLVPAIPTGRTLSTIQTDSTDPTLSTDSTISTFVTVVHDEIHKAGFTDISVYSDGETVTAEFSNPKYLSDQKAAGRVLRILLLNSPPSIKKLNAIIKRKRYPLLKVSVEPAHLEKYLLGEIRQDVFEKLIQVENTGGTAAPSPGSYIESDKPSLSYSFGVKPDIQTFLNDPSGFFQFRAGIKPFVILDLWKGAQIYARYDIPFYSDIESSNPDPSDSVRMDFWRYLGRDYSFEKLLIDQTVPLWKNGFGRISFGYLETMYAGVGGEVLHILGDGRFALGMESDWVRKREPSTQFGLMDVERHTLLANGFYYYAPLGITLQTQYGRFMAGDIGWRFIVSREYDTGIVIGGWYSITDTDDLAPPNRDYNDKGVFLAIPVRIFLNRDSPRRYSYSIRPWTRDVAAAPEHWQDLYGFTGDLTPKKFISRMEQIKD